jgi:Asp-tRNA(Asn)/Glu-tRNA(Gln) amidotransferase A subunit family amidase
MIDSNRLSARDAAARIADGSLTSEALVHACLDRIAARETAVGAWTHLDPTQAIEEARRRDREPSRGALHGVPIGVKDLIDTADMPTTYGSRAYAGHRPGWDAAGVALARGLGAVVLGKTVTTEFAAWSPGKTRNPHNLAHTPGGSSSGSAAAVADGMVPLAFGTQTAGSIIRPASYCGVVGYKPSFGLLPIAGIKALAPSLDTLGGFARNVTDMAWFIAALAERPDLVPSDVPTAPKIGLYRPEPWAQAQPETAAALDHAAAAFAKSGASVSDRGVFPLFDHLVAAQSTIFNYEAARNLAWERLQRIDEVTARTAAMFREGATVTWAQYEKASAYAAEVRQQASVFFADNDAMLVPAAPGEAPPAETTGDPVFNRGWTLLRWPCITLPALRGPNGLPVGIQLVARPGRDADLFAVARFAEAALGPLR